MSAQLQYAFGRSVRRRRAELGITLDQLARSSGISSGALSRIERGALNTSLQNAVAIASALSSDLGELLETDNTVSVLRRDEAQEYIDSETGVCRKLLARPGPGIELIHYTLPAHTATAEFAAHRARTIETFHVLTGLVSIIGDSIEVATLKTGDTAQAPGDRTHQIINPGDAEATLILLISRPQ